MAWNRFIKFLDEDDHLRLGDALVDSAEDFANLLQAEKLTARELIGQDLFSARPTDRVFRVRKLLGPLGPENVPVIRCVGLNYTKHSMFRLTSSYVLCFSKLSGRVILFTNNTSQRDRESPAAISLHLH